MVFHQNPVKQHKRLQQLPPLSRLGFTTGLRDQIACFSLDVVYYEPLHMGFFLWHRKNRSRCGRTCVQWLFLPPSFLCFIFSINSFFFLFKAAININRKLGKHVREMISLHLLKAAETVPAITPLTFH